MKGYSSREVNVKLAALFSGGKDSCMAVHEAMREGHEITHLVTMIPQRPDSYMFHYPNVAWTKLQGECMGIPVVQVVTGGEKERELEDMKAALAALGVDGVISGALESSYQKTRVDQIAGELGIESMAPLWHRAGKNLFASMLDVGFEIIVTAVAAEGLDESWLGRRIDYAAIAALDRKHNLHLMFEGGEAETFVLDAPMFRKRLVVTSAEKRWDGVRGSYEITGLKAVKK